MPFQLQRRPATAQHFTETLAPDLGIEMVYIPSGSFDMGSPKEEEGHRSREKPQHSVQVPSFCMGKYPVTQAQWQAVSQFPQINRELNEFPSHFSGLDRPVEKVSWLDTQEFCQRLSAHSRRTYRLPSEAEWEYACRAKTTTPFHFGSTLRDDLANYRAQDWKIEKTTYPGKYGPGELGKFRQETTPVGFFKVANNFGLYDMHGNVWEWCQDHWHNNYEGAPINGEAWINPPSSEKAPRVLRGGSWFNYPEDCRSAVRDNLNADYTFNYVGFRLVLTARTL
jgi:formylglycine-generating enzyme required for sulfatase activity